MTKALTLILSILFGIDMLFAQQPPDSTLIAQMSELSFSQLSHIEDSLKIELNKAILIEFLKDYKENGGRSPLNYYGYDNAKPLNSKYPEMGKSWEQKKKAYQKLITFKSQNDPVFQDATRKFKAGEITADQYLAAQTQSNIYLWKNNPVEYRRAVDQVKVQLTAYDCEVLLKLIAESTARGEHFNIDWIPIDKVTDAVRTNNVKAIHHQMTLLSQAVVAKHIKNEITINIEREVHSKEIAFELRLRTWGGFFSASDLIRIVKDNNGKWSAQTGYTGYNRYEEENEFTYEPLPKLDSIDWDLFETKLKHFLSLNLENQADLKLQYQNNHKSYEGKSSDFFSGNRFRDAHTFVIEIYNNTTYKKLSYLMPDVFIKELKSHELNSIEHEEFLEFTKYIRETFSENPLI